MKRLRLKVSANPFVPTIGTTYEDSIDGLLNPTPGGSDYNNIFDSFSSTGTSVWNDNLFGGGGRQLDLSGFVWWEETGAGNNIASNACAITKRHLLCSGHGQTLTNRDLTFVDPDGNAVIRVATDWISQFAEQNGDFNNSLTCLYLSADLPDEIAVYPIMADFSQSLVGLPVIRFNQFDQAHVCDVYQVDEILYLDEPDDPTRNLYYLGVQGGDSGHQAFFVVGTQVIPACAMVWNYTVGGAAPYFGARAANILEAAATLDARNDQTGYVPTLWRANLTAGPRSYMRRLMRAR